MLVDADDRCTQTQYIRLLAAVAEHTTLRVEQ